MIQSIYKHADTTWQQINSYLPSKKQIKLAAKVTVASVVTLATMEVAMTVGYYYYYFSVPIQTGFEEVSITDTVQRVFRKISEEGIFVNFRKGIVECTWTHCYFHPKVDPWYVMLKDDYFNRFYNRRCSAC